MKFTDCKILGSDQFTANGANTYIANGTDARGAVSQDTVNVSLPVNVTYQYDARGNLTNDSRRSFAYDDENQLTNVAVAGAWMSVFQYDGMLRRRIERDYTLSNGAWLQTNEVHYVYDGKLVIQERNANNSPQVQLKSWADIIFIRLFQTSR
jgi:hypothetical protein